MVNGSYGGVCPRAYKRSGVVNGGGDGDGVDEGQGGTGSPGEEDGGPAPPLVRMVAPQSGAPLSAVVDVDGVAGAGASAVEDGEVVGLSGGDFGSVLDGERSAVSVVAGGESDGSGPFSAVSVRVPGAGSGQTLPETFSVPLAVVVPRAGTSGGGEGGEVGGFSGGYFGRVERYSVGSDGGVSPA